MCTCAWGVCVTVQAFDCRGEKKAVTAIKTSPSHSTKPAKREKKGMSDRTGNMTRKLTCKTGGEKYNQMKRDGRSGYPLSNYPTNKYMECVFAVNNSAASWYTPRGAERGIRLDTRPLVNQVRSTWIRTMPKLKGTCLTQISKPTS
jgi:hypothetical protein